MAAPSPEVTSTNIAAVSFAFFGDEEVRRLSVCRLTSPIARDNLGAPVPGGLYDPSMGPLEMHERYVLWWLRESGEAERGRKMEGGGALEAVVDRWLF